MAPRAGHHQGFGEDGWPLDPLDPLFEEHERAQRRAEFHRTMRSLQARWNAGDLTAFDQAIRECWRHGEVPHWLVPAAADLVRLAMDEDEKRARREWDIHQRRWEALVELRQRRHELHDRGDDRGMSWESARLAVSEILEGTDAAGSDATVKTSYELVEAAGGEHATFESYLEVRRLRRTKQG
jgi:hypothetical protein